VSDHSQLRRGSVNQCLLSQCIGLAGWVWLGTWAIQPALAVQMSDGTVYFDNPPSLVEATTSEKAAGSTLATYYFTLSIPADAGEPLQRVVLAQEGGTDNIWFSVSRSRAFLGNNRRNLVNLTGVTQDRESRAVSVTFATPVPPGQTVTIALQPRQNPLFTGVYLFGVTAFPQGAKPYGQFLGFGRLQFYRDNFFRFF
jgi:hypothetical protein